MLNKPAGGRFGDIVESIGNTPLVELKRLSPKPEVKIFAKLEGRNPTGSVKDRVARAMIEAAEENGEIEPGMTLFYHVMSGDAETGHAMGVGHTLLVTEGAPELLTWLPDDLTVIA